MPHGIQCALNDQLSGVHIMLFQPACSRYRAFVVVAGMWCALLVSGGRAARAQEPPEEAQEPPYFVTYDDYLEEQGGVEVSVYTTSGNPRDGSNAYFAPWIEVALGVTKWWTSELYLEGVSMHHEGSAFTGWRLENRFRVLRGDHAINPILYAEYEHVNEATRIQKEIVGIGPLPTAPLIDQTEQAARELEARLILSSHLAQWNVSENVIFEKNFSASEGIEFGYSVGISRPLGDAKDATCRVCLGRFAAGVEAYGGLGSTQTAALGDTRQFVAPTIAWRLGGESQLKASIAIGLTDNSDRFLFRVAFSRDVR